MRWPTAVSSVVASAVAAAVLLVGWHFDADIAAAHARVALGSQMIATRCGPIEYQEAGAGPPLLVVHGSGGGHDQGLAFFGALARQGIRVIAMSRFGYLRTPMPVDASPAAQADAHACLLDALGISRAAVLGGSAGAPSAMQLAIRHPDRVNALVLLVPLAWKPPALDDSAAVISARAEQTLMQLLGSDFLFWAGLHIARSPLTERVLATPPEQVAVAAPAERARVNAMLDNILPVSARAEGLRSDSALGKSLPRYALESIVAPTLIVSTRDDGYGTFASARYTASQIVGARFIGFEHGGHAWVGHDDEIHAAIVQLIRP